MDEKEIKIPMNLERYQYLIHAAMLLSVIDNLLDACSDSVEFHTMVRYILREREEES